MDTSLTVEDLAAFTGQPAVRYGAWFEEALSQAEDLLELATNLVSLPSDGLSRRLVYRGILSMVEALIEGQASRELRFAPFRTETIGSYSYALSDKIAQGVPTGISWFDMAVTRLSSVETISSSAFSVYDRPGDFVEKDGRFYLPGPADTDSSEMGYAYGTPGRL